MTTFYIVSKPFANNDVLPVGRGTRCYEAYNCQTHEVVLLKDTWRVEGYLPKGGVYRRFREAGVSNIARLVAAGDVHGPTHTINAVTPRVLKLEQRARPFGTMYTTRLPSIL